jgi:hypothetical protein
LVGKIFQCFLGELSGLESPKQTQEHFKSLPTPIQSFAIGYQRVYGALPPQKKLLFLEAKIKFENWKLYFQNQDLTPESEIVVHVLTVSDCVE